MSMWSVPIISGGEVGGWWWVMLYRWLRTEGVITGMKGLRWLLVGIVTFLPLIFLFFIMCLTTSFPLPHLVLTITAYHVLFIFLINPFTKPRTVLLKYPSILVPFLPIASVLLPIPSSSYPRMYYT
jgi:hypothetical protein